MPEPASPAPTPAASTTGRGIALMLATVAVFTCMDAVTKTLSQSYSPPQILWVRFLIFLVIAVLMTARRGPLRAMRSRRPFLQIARSLLLAVEMGVFIIAFNRLSLADTTAIAAATPLIVTALAVVFLREQVGWRRWLAVGVGFAGVLVIVRPGMAIGNPLAVIPLIGAMMFAVYQLMVRRLAGADDATTTMLYTAVVGAIALSFVGPFYWQPPDARGWLLLAAIGLLGSAGHMLLIKALSLADASVLQPFSYAQIVGAVILGYLVFGDLPDLWTIAGALLICGAGLFVAYRERALRRRTLPPRPPA